MPRAMWRGSISFGLVTIPVRLSPAVKPHDVHFHLFHDADGGRIREKRVCEKDGHEVAYQHVVKGYELKKEQYVLVTRDELKGVDPVADKLISIEAVVPLADIDPVYFDATYYLSPEGKGAEKAYALFRQALEESGDVAFGRIVLSTRQHLAIVRAKDKALILTTMVFADEVKPIDAPAAASVSAKELQMAHALLKQLRTEFEPERYRDEHQQRVMALLKKKAAGEELTAAPEAEPEAITDLAEALQRSLAAVNERGRKPAEPARARRRTGRRAPSKANSGARRSRSHGSHR